MINPELVAQMRAEPVARAELHARRQAPLGAGRLLQRPLGLGLAPDQREDIKRRDLEREARRDYRAKTKF